MFPGSAREAEDKGELVPACPPFLLVFELLLQGEGFGRSELLYVLLWSVPESVCGGAAT